jgi:cytochrome c-type biogenesis protein CcmF
MAVLGRACLILALAVCVYGIIASIYGVRSGRREWADSGRRAVYALAGILTVSWAILEIAFLRSDFSFLTVQTHSSTTTPTFYRATAMWSSQEGSLLLWVWLLSMWSALVLFLTRKRMREVAAYATAVLLGFGTFFTALCIFFASPFSTLANAPVEGVGLNPLLRHPMMMIHPPMLYSGYTLFTIPFAFAIGALLAGRVDADWIRATRRFALGAWFFLGIGIVLGARWSYTELGWGGYWAWDPVENASLLPWLTGTAFIHSIMIQEKRGMLKMWNASLVLATGTLAIMGTFLVRSGILNSIHAFGDSTVGVPFLTLIGCLVAGSVILIVWRRDLLRSEHKLDSLLSREAMFLLNNVVLVSMAFVVFWGTFFPLISEAVTGTKASVGPPWFDRYITPLALVLVLLSGIGPIIAWRRATPKNARRNFLIPTAVALVMGAGLAAVGVAHKPLALLLFVFATFTLAVIGQEYWRGIGARRAMASESIPMAAVSLVRRNRRRYGGYLVHVGMAVLFIGVAASSSFNHTRDARLSPGDTVTVGDYDLTYVRATSSVAHDSDATGALLTLGAVVDVNKGGKHIATMRTQRGYFPGPANSLGTVGSLVSGESTSEVALRAGLRRDLWTVVTPDISVLMPLFKRANEVVPPGRPDLSLIALAAIANKYRTSGPPASFRFIDSPMVTWIWLGVLIVVGGALIAMWPSPDVMARRVRARQMARVAQELGRA